MPVKYTFPILSARLVAVRRWTYLLSMFCSDISKEHVVWKSRGGSVVASQGFSHPSQECEISSWRENAAYLYKFRWTLNTYYMLFAHIRWNNTSLPLSSPQRYSFSMFFYWKEQAKSSFYKCVTRPSHAQSSRRRSFKAKNPKNWQYFADWEYLLKARKCDRACIHKKWPYCYIVMHLFCSLQLRCWSAWAAACTVLAPLTLEPLSLRRGQRDSKVEFWMHVTDWE